MLSYGLNIKSAWRQREISTFFFILTPSPFSPWLHFRFHDEVSHWNMIYHRPLWHVYYEYAYLKNEKKKLNETNDIWHKIKISFIYFIYSAEGSSAFQNWISRKTKYGENLCVPTCHLKKPRWIWILKRNFSAVLY